MIDPKKPENKFTIDDIRSLKDLGDSYWDMIHREYTDDIIFSYATGPDQWKPETLAARGGRPVETSNIVNGFVRPVVNLVSQNPPAIAVYPIADGASKTNARLLSGIIRAIEYGCGAQREYTSSLESAVRGGLGVLRLIPRMSDLGDDDVDFIIHDIQDPTSVIIDPSATKSDFSDAQWVILKNSISERQYRKDYPDGKANAVGGVVDLYEMWIKHFTVTKETGFDGYAKKVKKLKILQYIFDDYEILETIDDYPGKYLPFAVVSGPKFSANGQVHFQSLTRELKGIQREINFLKSEQIASIACAPKATFYGDNNAFDSQEELQAWEESATNPRVFLGHKPGAQIKQFDMPQIPSAYIQSVQSNIDLARVVTGIYPDPSIQQGLSPASGKAIKEQQAGQAIATYHFVNSLNFAIKHIGEIILDLLPYYWNDNRVRLSMGVDGKYTSVSMGDEKIDEAENFDLAYGRYAVSISTGPSYMSQKDALIEMLLDSIKTNPQAMTIALPWIIQQINLPGSEELADMFSLTLPPEIQQYLQQMKQQGDGDPEEKLKSAILTLQQMAQDGQQKDQMIQQLTAALEQETAQLQSKEQELEIKKQIESEKNQSKIILETIKQEHAKELKEMDARIRAMEASMKHESNLDTETHKAVLDSMKTQEKTSD